MDPMSGIRESNRINIVYTVCHPQFRSARQDTPADIMVKNRRAENKFPAFHNGFCFFTEIGKNRAAQYQEYIFKKGEIKKHHDQPDHNTHHDQYKAPCRTVLHDAASDQLRKSCSGVKQPYLQISRKNIIQL